MNNLNTLFKQKWREIYLDKKCPSPAEFRKVIDKCNRIIKDKLYKGHDIVLPESLGTLTIRHKKLNITTKQSQPVDWKKSKELGKKIRHQNFMTDGKIYKLYWFTKVSRKILNHYFFVPCEAFNRGITKAVKRGNVWPEL